MPVFPTVPAGRRRRGRRVVATLLLAPVLGLALLAAGGIRGPALAQGSGEDGTGPVPVDVALVLAVDVSGSMDLNEHRLQRAGYMAALVHPDVIDAIAGGILGRIAVTYVEWAGPSSQVVVVPWRVIDGLPAATAFVEALGARPIAQIRGTSISGALAFAAALFETGAIEATRRVIDISGDGPNNMGPPVVEARDSVVARGVTINGLPIVLSPSGRGGFGRFWMNPEGLLAYYRGCVIGGPGAFALAVASEDQLPEAIRRKMVLEIAGRRPPAPVLHLAQTGGPIDCFAGERLRRPSLPGP